MVIDNETVCALTETVPLLSSDGPVNTSCRLHLHASSSHNGGWSSLTNDQNQWLQVKFGQRVEIRRVATQGRQASAHYQWVTSYTFNYSSDGLLFYQYRTNKNQTVSSFIHKPYDSVFLQCLHRLCHSCDTGHCFHRAWLQHGSSYNVACPITNSSEPFCKKTMLRGIHNSRAAYIRLNKMHCYLHELASVLLVDASLLPSCWSKLY